MERDISQPGLPNRVRREDDVPSHHHQSVATHPGYVPAAWAPDGTLEAMEHPSSPFRLAVQWHPEQGTDPRLFEEYKKLSPPTVAQYGGRFLARGGHTETAEGDWLKLVSRAGLKWDQAILQYLLDGKHAVERKGSSFFGGVSLSLDRPRPPKAEEK